MEDLKILADQMVHLRLSEKQLALLQQYETLLLEWNEKVNLTAIRDRGAIRIKHFLDSFTCLNVMRNTPVDRIIDIGTGAGFPGIPIKIVQPTVDLHLVESIGKKARFCQLVVDDLRLTDVTVHPARAEDLAHLPVHRESYDWALARAVAKLPILVEYVLPFVRMGGYMLAQKGISAHQEVHEAANAMKILGGELSGITKVELPGVVEERYLIVIRKVFPTPFQYPRSGGLPAKKPIL